MLYKNKINFYYHELFHSMNIMNQNTPEQQVELNKALIKVLAETKDIVADSTNPFHKNKYASLSAHLHDLKPIFAKHGLGILQMPIGEMNCVGIRTTILHKDGGSVSSDAYIPASEGLKGQEAGSIYSYLRRYALASIAGVATEDDDAETNRIEKSSGALSNVKVVYNENFKSVSKTNAKPAEGFVAPFGDAKGTPLTDLPLRSEDKTKKCADLNYWANFWQPRPFGDTGKISAKDMQTKAEAKRLWDEKSGATPASEQEAPTQTDDVPF